MAKKTDIDVSSNLDDFGDFDFNMDESGTKKNKVARPSKMKSDYIPAMASGFLSGLKRELSNKLPQTAGFVNELDSAFDQIKSMTSSFTSEAGPMVKSLGRSTNRLMPLVKPFMPRGAYNWVTGKLSSIPEDSQEMSAEERMGQQISSDINAAMQGSNAADQVRSNMGEITENMRHKAMMGSLGNLGREMHFVSSFLQSTMTAYMKKDLELGYRQLYTQRDISSTLRATAKLVEVELKHITHNTGLPESVKAEDFKRRGTFVDTIRGQMSKQMSAFISNIKTQVFDQAKDALSMLSDAVGGAADISEMTAELENQPLSLKNIIAKGLFSLGGSFVGTKAGEKLAPLIKSFGKGGIEGGLEYGVAKLFKMLRGKTNRGELGIFNDLIGNALPDDIKMQYKIDNVAANDPNKPVAFDISTRDAIVSVIPGWLSKIHKVTSDIQDPTTKHAELVYDAREKDFINPLAKSGPTFDKVSEELESKRVSNASSLRAITGLMAATRVHSGKSFNEIRDIYDDKMKQAINLLRLNLAMYEPINGFNINKFDAFLNGQNIDAEYIKNASSGFENEATFRKVLTTIRDSVTIANNKGTRSWDTKALNDLNNSITDLAQGADAAHIANFITNKMNNGSDAEWKTLMTINKALPPEQRFFNTETGEIDNEKYRAWQHVGLSKDIGDDQWSMQHGIMTKLEEYATDEQYSKNPSSVLKSRKANAEAHAAAMTQYSDVTDSFKNINAEKDEMTYRKDTLEALYTEDFLKIYLQQDVELYGFYKPRADVFAFETVIAAEHEKAEPSLIQAATAYKAFYAAVLKAKSQKAWKECRGALLGAVNNIAFYYRVAEELLRYCTSLEEAKSLARNYKQRIGLIRNSDVIKRMTGGEGIEVWVRKQLMHDKGAHVGLIRASKLGEAAVGVVGKTTPAVVAAGARIYSGVKDVVDIVTGKAKETYEKAKNEFAEGGLKNVSVGGTKIGDVASSVTGMYGAVTGTEYTPPTEDEVQKRIENLIKSDPDKYKGKRGAAKAAKEVASAIEEEQRKHGILKEQAEKVKGSFSRVTGRVKAAFTHVKEKVGSAFDEVSGRMSIADNVAKITAILEKRYGSLTEGEINQIKENELSKVDQEEVKKERKGFFKSIGGAIGGAFHALNPFKATAAAIAAKYKLDSSAVESAFHGDFQRYFEYRKEMDTYIAANLRRGGLGGMMGGLFRGVGRGIGGIGRGIGSAAGGIYHGLGAAVKGIGPAIGNVVGGVYHGAGALMGGVGHAIGGLVPTAWDMTKKSFGLAKGAVKNTLGAIFTRGNVTAEDEPFYALYCKDQLGLPGWEKNPILSVRDQKKGIYDPDTKGKILSTDAISGPVCDSKGNFLITEDDWSRGIVNIEGKKISTLAKAHKKRAGLINIRGGGLLGGALSGIGSLLGGTASGVGSMLSGLLGFNMEAFKKLGSTLWGGVKGIGSGIGGMLGIGTSEKAQKKKYSVLLGKIDEITALLGGIRKNTAKATKRKGSAETDKDYANKQSKAEIDPKTGKPKDAAATPVKSGWQKLIDFFKDPKGALLTAFAPIRLVAKGVGKLAKFFCWTAPKGIIKGVWSFGSYAATSIANLVTIAANTAFNLLGKIPGLNRLGKIGKLAKLGTRGRRLARAARAAKKAGDSAKAYRLMRMAARSGKVASGAARTARVARTATKLATAATGTAAAVGGTKLAAKGLSRFIPGFLRRAGGKAAAKTAAKLGTKLGVRALAGSNIWNPVGWALTAGLGLYDAVEGYNDTDKLAQQFGVKDPSKLSMGQRGAGAAGGLINGLLLGLPGLVGADKYINKAMYYTGLGHVAGAAGAGVSALGKGLGFHGNGKLSAEDVKELSIQAAKGNTYAQKILDENKGGFWKGTMNTLGYATGIKPALKAGSFLMGRGRSKYTEAERAELMQRAKGGDKEAQQKLRDDKGWFDKLFGTDENASFGKNIKQFFSSIWTKFISGIKASIRGIFTLITDPKKILKNIKEWWDSPGIVGKTMSTVNEYLKKAFDATVSGLKGAVKGLVKGFNWCVDGFKSAFEGIKKGISKAGDAIIAVKDGFVSFVKNPMGALKKGWRMLSNAVGGVWNAIIRTCKSVVEWVADKLSWLPKWAGNKVRSIASGLHEWSEEPTKETELIGGESVETDTNEIANKNIISAITNSQYIHKTLKKYLLNKMESFKAEKGLKPEFVRDVHAAFNMLVGSYNDNNYRIQITCILKYWDENLHRPDNPYAYVYEDFGRDNLLAIRDGYYDESRHFAELSSIAKNTVDGKEKPKQKSVLSYSETLAKRVKELDTKKPIDFIVNGEDPTDTAKLVAIHNRIKVLKLICFGDGDKPGNPEFLENDSWLNEMKLLKVQDPKSKDSINVRLAELLVKIDKLKSDEEARYKEEQAKQQLQATPPAEATKAQAEVKLQNTVDPVVAKPGDLIATSTTTSEIVGNTLLSLKGEKTSDYQYRFDTVKRIYDMDRKEDPNKPPLLSYLDDKGKQAAYAANKLAVEAGQPGSKVQEAEKKKEPSITKKAEAKLQPKPVSKANGDEATGFTSDFIQQIADQSSDYTDFKARLGTAILNSEYAASHTAEEVQRLINSLREKNKHLFSNTSTSVARTTPTVAAPEPIAKDKVEYAVNKSSAPATLSGESKKNSPEVVSLDNSRVDPLKPKTPVEAMLESTTTADKKDLLIEQFSRRVTFLENYISGKNPMTELLTRIADGTDKNNELTIMNGEAVSGQAKNWEEQYAALKKSQSAQTNLFMKASNYGKQPSKPVNISPMINLSQGVS